MRKKILGQMDRIAMTVLKASQLYEETFDKNLGVHRIKLRECVNRTCSHRATQTVAYLLLEGAWNDALCWAENYAEKHKLGEFK